MAFNSDKTDEFTASTTTTTSTEECQTSAHKVSTPTATAPHHKKLDHSPSTTVEAEIHHHDDHVLPLSPSITSSSSQSSNPDPLSPLEYALAQTASITRTRTGRTSITSCASRPPDFEVTIDADDPENPKNWFVFDSPFLPFSTLFLIMSRQNLSLTLSHTLFPQFPLSSYL